MNVVRREASNTFHASLPSTSTVAQLEPHSVSHLNAVPFSSSPVSQPSLSTRWRYVNRNRFACSTRNGLNNWPKNSAWPQQSNSKRAEHKSNNNNNVDSKSNNNNSVSKHKWINKFMKHNRRFNRSALSLTPQAPPDFDLNSTHFFASPCLSHWRKTIVVAFVFHTLHFFYA